jgi:putative phosphoesterase
VAKAPRIALIADVHGNLVALREVLADISDTGADEIICLGDVGATGPRPRETIERVAELGCAVVRGNADRFLLEPDPEPEKDEDEDARRIREIELWGAEQLEVEHRAILSDYLPLLERHGLCCYHGSPRSDMEQILPDTPAATLDAALGEHAALVFAGGHTHQQMLRRHRSSLVVNPGSVGMPFELRDDDRFHNPPFAEYAIAEGGEVEFHRVPLDVADVAADALRSGMPHAGWWVKDWSWS